MKNKSYGLLFGCICVLIAGYYYAPWEENTINIVEKFIDTGGIFSIKLMVVKLFFPILTTYIEGVLFISNYIAVSAGFTWKTMAITCIAFWIYVFSCIASNRYSEVDDSLQGYIANLCLDNIVMYLARFFAYQMTNILIKMKMELLIIGLIVVVYIFTMYAVFIFLIYFMVWMLVLIIPTLLVVFLPLNNMMMQVIGFLVLFLAQMFWKKYASYYFLSKLIVLFKPKKIF